MEGLINSWPLFAMIPIFYFFMIRPQQKKQKEQAAFQGSLEKGKQVVTLSGVIGKISKLDDEAVITLQLDTKTFVKVTRNSISKEMTEALKTNYDLG